MKKIIFICICIVILLSACTLQIRTDGDIDIEGGITGYDDIFCTADVQECPDGSFVARDPEKNCEFKEC